MPISSIGSFPAIQEHHGPSNSPKTKPLPTSAPPSPAPFTTSRPTAPYGMAAPVQLLSDRQNPSQKSPQPSSPSPSPKVFKWGIPFSVPNSAPNSASNSAPTATPFPGTATRSTSLTLRELAIQSRSVTSSPRAPLTTSPLDTIQPPGRVTRMNTSPRTAQNGYLPKSEAPQPSPVRKTILQWLFESPDLCSPSQPSSPNLLASPTPPPPEFARRNRDPPPPTPTPPPTTPCQEELIGRRRSKGNPRIDDEDEPITEVEGAKRAIKTQAFLTKALLRRPVAFRRGGRRNSGSSGSSLILDDRSTAGGREIRTKTRGKAVAMGSPLAPSSVSPRGPPLGRVGGARVQPVSGPHDKMREQGCTISSGVNGIDIIVLPNPLYKMDHQS